MDSAKRLVEFNAKFCELNPMNQKYIIAIQQALTFAQASTEKTSTGNKCEQSA